MTTSKRSYGVDKSLISLALLESSFKIAIVLYMGPVNTALIPFVSISF